MSAADRADGGGTVAPHRSGLSEWGGPLRTALMTGILGLSAWTLVSVNEMRTQNAILTARVDTLQLALDKVLSDHETRLRALERPNNYAPRY